MWWSVLEATPEDNWAGDLGSSGSSLCTPTTSFVHAFFWLWEELSCAAACLQGSHFIQCFTWYPNSWWLVSWFYFFFWGTERGLSWFWMFFPHAAWEPAGLGWDLNFAPGRSEQLVCRLSRFTCSACASVVAFVSFLCYLTTCIPTLWFQQLRRSICVGSCTFASDCFVCGLNFVCVCMFCNFFEVLHPYGVNTDVNVSRASCWDVADNPHQGISWRYFSISVCWLGIEIKRGRELPDYPDISSSSTPHSSSANSPKRLWLCQAGKWAVFLMVVVFFCLLFDISSKLFPSSKEKLLDIMGWWQISLALKGTWTKGEEWARWNIGLDQNKRSSGSWRRQ